MAREAAEAKAAEEAKARKEEKRTYEKEIAELKAAKAKLEAELHEPPEKRNRPRI